MRNAKLQIILLNIFVKVSSLGMYFHISSKKIIIFVLNMIFIGSKTFGGERVPVVQDSQFEYHVFPRQIL